MATSQCKIHNVQKTDILREGYRELNPIYPQSKQSLFHYNAQLPVIELESIHTLQEPVTSTSFVHTGNAPV